MGHGFLDAVLGVCFSRPPEGQKPWPLKPYPQKLYLCKTFDRFTGPKNNTSQFEFLMKI